MIWKENRIFLGILAVLFAANVFFFFTYRVQYETRLKDAEARMHAGESALLKARQARVAAEQQLASYGKVQAALQNLYEQRWSTETQRLTAMILEIKRLNAAAGMSPPSYAFTQAIKEKEKARAGAIGTTTVGITFSVQGDYQQIRRLINLLELSEQFVIIDSITLAGSASDPKLTLNLQLKTVFREPHATNAMTAAKEM
jgi:hypothetical protein